MKLVKYPDSGLFRPLPPFEGDFVCIPEIAENMFATMQQNEGVGLAANQVGIDFAIFVVDYAGEKLVCVNPQIIEYSNEKSFRREGCLSFPMKQQHWLQLERSNRVVLSYQDQSGNHQTREFVDYFARIIQHEIDHLYGKTIISNLPKFRKTTFLRKMKRK